MALAGLLGAASSVLGLGGGSDQPPPADTTTATVSNLTINAGLTSGSMSGGVSLQVVVVGILLWWLAFGQKKRRKGGRHVVE